MNFAACYITASSKKEAEKIAMHLLEKRLIACANVFPCSSLYWWKEKIEKSKEFVLICKTVMNKSDTIINEVKKVHPYSVPCINFLSIKKGNPDYLKWVKENMK